MVCCPGQNELNLTKPALNVEKKPSSGRERKSEGTIVYQPKIGKSSPLNSQPVFASESGSKHSIKDKRSSPRQRSKLVDQENVCQDGELNRSESVKKSDRNKAKSPKLLNRQGTHQSINHSQEIKSKQNFEEEKDDNVFEKMQRK